MSVLDDLIQRMEKLSGPDRGVDAAIVHAIGKSRFDFMDSVSPRYTESIDSALTLIPPKWDDLWSVHGGNYCLAGAQLELDGVETPDGEIIVTAATPAIALCIAALRARAAEAEGE